MLKSHTPLGFEVRPELTLPPLPFPYLPHLSPPPPTCHHAPASTPPRPASALPLPHSIRHKHTELPLGCSLTPWALPHPRPQGHYNPSSILLDLGSDGCGLSMPSLLSRTPPLLPPLHSLLSPSCPPPFPAHYGSGTLTPSPLLPRHKQPSSLLHLRTPPRPPPCTGQQPLVHVGSTFLSLATASSPKPSLFTSSKIHPLLASCLLPT